MVVVAPATAEDMEREDEDGDAGRPLAAEAVASVPAAWPLAGFFSTTTILSNSSSRSMYSSFSSISWNSGANAAQFTSVPQSCTGPSRVQTAAKERTGCQTTSTRAFLGP